MIFPPFLKDDDDCEEGSLSVTCRKVFNPVCLDPCLVLVPFTKGSNYLPFNISIIGVLACDISPPSGF